MQTVEQIVDGTADWSELHLRLKGLTRDYYNCMLEHEHECGAEILANINITTTALLFLHTSGRLPSGTSANRRS